MVSISLIFIFLSVNTELHQLFTLPTFIEHYLEHKKENSSETFGNYLTQHYYGKISHKHNDNHKDHEQLPFKTQDCTATHISMAVVDQTPLNGLSNITYQVKAYPLNKEDHSLSSFQNNIWQPPKFS